MRGFYAQVSPAATRKQNTHAADELHFKAGGSVIP